VATNWKSTLYAAMKSAFKRDELERLLQFEMDVPLSDVVGEDTDYSYACFELVNWAERQNRLNDLIKAARTARPRNQVFKDFAEGKIGIPEPKGDNEVLGPGPDVKRPGADKEGRTAMPLAVLVVASLVVLGAGGGMGYFVRWWLAPKPPPSQKASEGPTPKEPPDETAREVDFRSALEQFRTYKLDAESLKEHVPEDVRNKLETFDNEQSNLEKEGASTRSRVLVIGPFTQDHPAGARVNMLFADNRNLQALVYACPSGGQDCVEKGPFSSGNPLAITLPSCSKGGKVFILLRLRRSTSSPFERALTAEEWQRMIVLRRSK
jgi:hypothetical protein